MTSSDQHPLHLFFAALCAHSSLDEGHLRAFRALHPRLRRLDAGSYVVREGALPSHCSILVEGFASQHKLTGEGLRQILAVRIPGDALDLQNMFLNASDHAVQMLTTGVVADYSREQMQELVENDPELGQALVKQSLIEASILREWVVNVGRRVARARIAHLLCELAVRLDARGFMSPLGLELPMTQEQLADATGLTAVHVNRVLKGLEKDGIIRRQRRRIHFNDWLALQDAGDFTRAYLHIPGEDGRADPPRPRPPSNDPYLTEIA